MHRDIRGLTDRAATRLPRPVHPIHADRTGWSAETPEAAGSPSSAAEELDSQHERALTLGAGLLHDRSEDPEEPLRVYADSVGHPFCIFVAEPLSD